MECPNGCGYTYTVISNFEKHLQKYCTKNKYYTCLYCNASFHLNDQLKKHLLMIHKCFWKCIADQYDTDIYINLFNFQIFFFCI